MRFIYVILSIGLILLLSFFSLHYWKAYYPLYLEVYDVAYHLAVSVGMDRAGGLTATSFWQDASRPVPAYYPPFFHLCGLMLLRLGVGLNFLLKYLDWMLYPAALFSLWLFMSVCFGSRIGFYSLVLMSLPPLFMEKVWGHPTFGLFCVLVPLVFLSLLKKRYITTLLLIFLSLATHMSAGIILLILLIYAIHSRKDRKFIFMLLAALVILGLPVLWIAAKRISFYNFFQWKGLISYLRASLARGGFTAFFDYKNQFYVHLGILGVLGALVCYFRRGRYLLFPSIFIALGMINNIASVSGDPGAFRYNQMLPMVMFPMLGGVFLDAVHGRFERLASLMKSPYTLLALKSFAILIILIIAVYRSFYKLSQQPEYNRTPAIAFLNRPYIWLPYKLLFTTGQRARLLELIKENVAEDEMIFNSAGMNLTNTLSAFSRRSFTRDIPAAPKMLIAERASSGYRFFENMNPQFSVYILEDKAKAGKASPPIPILKFTWIRNGFILTGILIILDLFLWAFFKIRDFVSGGTFPKVPP